MQHFPMWQQCIDRLAQELPNDQLTMWIFPLQAEQASDSQWLLWAPNRFAVDWIEQKLLERIRLHAREISGQPELDVSLRIGEAGRPKASPAPRKSEPPKPQPQATVPEPPQAEPVEPGDNNEEGFSHNLNRGFTFETFVQGKSNQLACAASQQVAANAGASYNPLLIYGGVGLGKTHLMHAVGNQIIDQQADKRVIYLHSERYVQEMITAIRNNNTEQFKNFYRGIDALLIDDIQFFATKPRSQEEFFHTFNALIEQGKQIVMTCDRYPKEIEGLEERLKSRFGWGLTVAVEPPDMETRVAILHSKAEQSGIDLDSDVAFFIARRIQANIRELEGALRRVIVTTQFSKRPITIESTKDALKDMISAHAKMITLDNIQRTVAKYYNVKIQDLTGSRRTRSIARPRQVAMALAKELTSHSLPEIGESFGGRDHTTVLHAVRKIEELRESDSKISDDYNLLRHTLNV
ncbi:chromosomal replication initiator protein DnaA [Guyparkeria hydrothermalis]|uniref:chromosomal replication initiator protein DnaA n=1 Tax=Guyparkeria hydrothermalis TaxID=923 RepID=UPI0020216EF6|nr:chromosomal replication initiator protein DnaA [Guyparkeria hydrothermalis]MCL7744964.1 chromosomal replication initiator protein DnaA [Guyparkeria hydrothermalis]